MENIQAFVTQKCGFPSSDQLVLRDDAQDPSKQPTRQNILAAMRWLAQDAKSGDVLFLHFSGHGSQQKDTDGDEQDGHDETICPVDFQSAGMITDDEMHASMVAPLPEGVKFISIFDCCHSGTMLDLPYTYTTDGSLEIKEIDNRAAIAKGVFNAGLKYLSGDANGAVKELKSGFMSAIKSSVPGGGEKKSRAEVKYKECRADVVQFSGCMDNQTSADAHIEGSHTGAMSYSFIKAMEKHNFNVTYQDLLRSIREILQGKYSQLPQMSAGRKLRMDVPFTM